MPARPCHFIDTEDAFCRLLGPLEREPAIAVDTESNSFHAYFEKVCLIQLSTEEADYAVDPLRVDVRPLGKLLADPAVEVVFHAADFDIRGLKRDYGMKFTRLFDTMLAAKLLGYPKMSLAVLVRRHFGMTLEKEHQRSDWGQRPLSAAQLEYAYKDTRYLLALRNVLRAELERAGRVAEAERIFKRQASCEPRKKRFDKEGFRRLRGFAALDRAQRELARALYLLREERARSVDRPPFKVFGDEAIIELARLRPRSEDELLQVRGIGARTVQRHGQAILRALGKSPAAQGAAA
ncbi:MAG: ribonuclease D [Myxococcales bacterium]|jgi:ribonuclease D